MGVSYMYFKEPIPSLVRVSAVHARNDTTKSPFLFTCHFVEHFKLC